MHRSMLLPLLFLFLLGALPFRTVVAQEFEVPITVSDGANSIELTFGVHPNGTDGIDEGLDEIVPPVPPAGVFDARFTINNEGFSKDIRDNMITEKTYTMTYQAATGAGPITLTWDMAALADLGTFTFMIVDNIDGMLFSPLDMTTVGSLDVSTSALLNPGLRILMTPDTGTANEGEAEVPAEFVVHGNYPNPFNPTTTIAFDLPEAAEVTEEVTDLLGRQVLVLPKQRLAAGARHTVALEASSLASGMYFYRLIAEMATQTQIRTGQMQLLK